MVGREHYDTKEGIDLYLGSLWRLNKLISQRYEAYYECGERLHGFIIMGRWATDSCGNFGRITSDFIPKEKLPHIPDVLTMEEFWNYIQAHVPESEKISIGWSLVESGIPPVGVVCHECGQPWSIGNCHDTSIEHADKTIPLTEFAGKTLGKIKATFAAYPDAVYWTRPSCLICNDKVNDGAWRGEQDGITDEYVIQKGDESYFHVRKYFHKDCRRRYNARRERKYFEEIFAEAGFKNFELGQTENRYCGCEACAPWFWVHTPIGELLIGWRKRVININWGGTGKNFLHLFGGEDVTKGAGFIHAWGRKKAVEYLSRIRDDIRIRVMGYFGMLMDTDFEIYNADTDIRIESAEVFYSAFEHERRIDLFREGECIYRGRRISPIFLSPIF